ncbi:MAG: T9SS type A sorting domain-containing protein [Bacteroidetes bacterium]|nr:T9SS type A sorting domain-containing protein [Bacteroidota bacterium]
MKKFVTLFIVFSFFFAKQVFSQCGMTITPSTTNATCNGNCDGIATVNVTGGSPGYTYLWNPSSQTSSTATGLCAGIYTVTVTDAVPCTQTETVVITEPAPLIADAGNPTICWGSCATLGGSPSALGGTPGYTYLWSPAFAVSDSTIANPITCSTGSSNYTLTVTDANGCSSVSTTMVTYYPALGISFSKTNPSTCAVCDGAMASTVNGGTSPFAYWWNTVPNQYTPTATGLCIGNYTLIVTDANGCTAKSWDYLSLPKPQVTGTVTNTSCTDGSIDISVSNGLPPYTYLWNTGATTQDISNLSPGNYYVAVTDANSCTLYGTSFIVTQGPPGPTCSQITGKVYYDNNLDCVFNGTDAGWLGVTITAVPGPYYSITNSSGDYSMIVPPGTYTVTQTVPANWGELCPGSGYSSVTANAASTAPNIDFADTTSAITDLGVWCNTGTASPGFPRIYYLFYRNLGNTAMNGTVYLVIDPLDNFVSASVTPSSVSGDTIFWNFINLYPFQYPYITVTCSNLPANPALIGNVISYCAKVLPIVGDINPADNTSCGYKTITGSYDPNEKEVSPEGSGPNGAILPTDTVLTYAIHFQNTGTTYAQTVIVRDTLSLYLNPASVEDGPSSHAHTFSMSGNGILKWTFNNIWLPDSSSNFAGSNGYITFRIHLKPNLPVGTVIANKADIYFDYNPPITTNSTINTISNTISAEEINKNISIQVYPNPFSSSTTLRTDKFLTDATLTIYNCFGQTVAQIKNISGQTVTFYRDNLPSGLYFVRLTQDNKVIATKKLVITD